MHLLISDPVLVTTQLGGMVYREPAHTVIVELTGNSVTGLTFSIVKFVMAPCVGVPEKPQLEKLKYAFTTTQPVGIDWFVQIDTICGDGLSPCCDESSLPPPGHPKRNKEHAAAHNTVDTYFIFTLP
jgi:hypothetical protein